MKFKKAFGLLLAIIMVFGLAVPTMADEEEATTTEATETETVTLHKMMFHPKDAEDNASITDKWTQEQINEMKTQPVNPAAAYDAETNPYRYDVDQDYKSAVDDLESKLSGDPATVAKWEGYIGLDANGKYELYQGQELTKEEFFGQGVTEAVGVYFQWFDKENNPLKVTYDATSTDKYTIAVASAEEASTLPPLPALSASREAGKTYLMAAYTTANGIEFPTKGMEGEYEIREIFEKSTYENGDKEITTTAAVPVELTMPMVAPNGIVKNAHVYPKNTDDTPQVDKNFEKDFADNNKTDVNVESGDANLGPDYQNYKANKSEINTILGKKIPYAVKTLIPANAHYKNFVWEDIMTHGLTYRKDLKNGLNDNESKVAIRDTGGKLLMFKKDKTDSVGELNINTDYTLKETESGFNIELTDAGLKKINGRDEAVEIRMHYTAKINASNIVEIPDSNDIRVEFGRQPKQKHQEFTPDKDKISLKKTWAKGIPESDKVEATFKLEKYDEKDGWTTVEGYEAIVLNSENGWQKDNIPVEIGGKYRFTEVAIEGYTEEYVGYEDGVYTVKNYKETVEPKDGKLIIDKKFTGTTPKEGEELVFDLWQIKDGSEKNLYTIKVKAKGSEFIVESINGEAPAAGENNKLPYTFEGLEAGTYKLTERLSGYTAFPNVTEGTTTEAPKIQLENKKTNDNPKPKNPSEPKVRTGGKKFVKTDNTTDKTRLAGAEFVVLRNTEVEEKEVLQYLVLKDDTQHAGELAAYNTARDNYLKAYADRNRANEIGAKAEALSEKERQELKTIYTAYADELKKVDETLTAAPTDAAGAKKMVDAFDNGVLKALEEARDKAFATSNMEYEWTTLEDSKKDSKKLADFPNAYILKSDEDGRFEITGLPFGSYKLRELKAPEDYALMTSDVPFTVGQGSYQGKSEEVQYNKADTNNGYGQRVENKKLTIPPTGGIGTVIFTVAGLALMAIAIIAISKKHSDDLLEEK